MSDKAPDPEAQIAAPQRIAHPALGMLGVATLVLVGWALHVMQPVFLPIAFAVFLALLLNPVDDWAARMAGGRAWVGHLAAMLLLALALAGFGNYEIGAICAPRLTTVDVHAEQIGAEAARLVGGLLSGKARASRRRIEIPPELILRETTPPPR
ncbi:substrate-binding domain-containing protein [Limimaricola sp. ASW11-118]|uniref:Substrate-binding domain-containing protein n=1 Tax=Limimaricola litoreus TaxID=2955316 RepID=A0A9X2FNA6_9RHOB|nr:substrate-binding domain-containing protein [Limimaricola litoreus]MCP1168367.1 substrate-binding domain-containing protein [Limimaricola litoreus]